MQRESKMEQTVGYVILTAFLIAVLFPLLYILMNSFKGHLFVSNDGLGLLSKENTVGFQNYIYGLTKIKFASVFGTSLFITVGSVSCIVFLTAMTAWYLARVKSLTTTLLYYLFVLSMIVPFQMVMFTIASIANLLNLSNPLGIIFIYVGFGSGMSVFMYTGFIKGIPLDIEEAATIDGCGPLETFFYIVLPLLKPIAITISILNVMWIWNDYLLPYLALDSKYQTIPIAVQSIFTGSHGAVDYGGLMAMLVLSIIPIIIFYVFCQKYIVKGIVAGAVKG